MSKIIFSSIILIFFNITAFFAQDLAWLKNSSAENIYTNHSFYASCEYNNDFYFAGDFWPDMTIDGVNISVGLETSNAFIIKMNASGVSSSLLHLKSDDYVRINKLEVNPVSGSIIAIGNFRNDLSFDNESWEAPYYTKGFIMSIHPDGTLDWMKEIEPQSNVSFSSGGGLAIDEMGNIFVGMESFGKIKIEDESFVFEPETGGVIMAKFNADGELLKAEKWEGVTFEGGMDITDMALDQNNDLLIVGSVLGTMLIDGAYYDFSESYLFPFIIKLEENLDLKWSKTYEGSYRSTVRDVYTDENDLILSLQYAGAIDIDGTMLTGSGSYGDLAILSVDENADLNWVENFTLSENLGIQGVYGNSITEWLGQYYIGGMYQGDVVHEGDLILDNEPWGNVYQYPFLISLSKDGELASIYDFVGTNEVARIKNISSNDSHLLFGGDFTGKVAIGDTSVSTINEVLFYGALESNTTDIKIFEDKSDLIFIYPTLTDDYINLNTETKVDKFSIISSLGEVIKEYTEETRQIDVQDLASGSYYILAKIDGRNVSVKFIKL